MKTLVIHSILMLLFFLLTMIQTAHSQPQILHIYFLDVGQGESMLLHQPGKCAALIDAGPLINGHLITEKIKTLGINELDFVLFSHPHLDHFGGLFDLAPRVKIKHFYDNGKPNLNREYFDDYLQIRQRQPHSVLGAGDILECGNSRLSILHPIADASGDSSINENSLALMISFGTFKLLHMGDVSGVAEESLISRGYDLKADILKIAHHGAADATSSALLDSTQPTHALIGVAQNNWIDAPSATVLKRLDTYNIHVYRTDLNKSITILVSYDTYTISPERR